MENGQIFIGYLISGIEDDVLKLEDNPSEFKKFEIIQRLFIVMMHIYNLGDKRRIK